MITEEHINEMEERCKRMFPFIDTTAVNMIMGEIQALRNILKANPHIMEEIKVVEKVIEEKVIEPIERKFRKAKKEEEAPKEPAKEEPKADNAN